MYIVEDQYLIRLCFFSIMQNNNRWMLQSCTYKHTKCHQNQFNPYIFLLTFAFRKVKRITITKFALVITFRLPAWFRCSHSQIPCHVPRFSLPSVIGIVNDDPRKHAFTCAGCMEKYFVTKHKIIQLQ